MQLDPPVLLPAFGGVVRGDRAIGAEPDRATSSYSQSNSTPQSHGNLLRANALVFADPFGPAPAPASSGSDAPSGASPGGPTEASAGDR